MKRILRYLTIALMTVCLLPPPQARAGFLSKLGWTGAAIAGADVAIIAEATVVAVVAVGTSSYPSAIANLKSKLAAHRIVGGPALSLGIGTALHLYPRMLASALVVKTEAEDNAGNTNKPRSSQPTGTISANGDPNDEEPGQEPAIVVKRPLRADDLGVAQETELQGQVSLEGKTLTVRVDMIKGALVDGKPNLGISGSSAIGNLQLLAKESGATTLRIEGTLANDRLLRVLAQRYGAQFETVGGREILTIPVT